MKLKALLLIAFISTATFAQDTEFKFSKDGLTDFVVGSFEGSSKDLYKWTLAWVKENKGNKVLSSVENEKIVFQGSKDNFICSKAGGTNVCTFGSYTVEINFKEGKYKFDVTGLEETDKKGNTSILDLNNFSQYYDKDGNLKKYMNDVPTSYEGLFNGLNKNLLATLEKKKKAENW
jgi:hypothetical protein